WLGAVGVAQLLVEVIKLATHRPRPLSLYSGVEQFSFPSGHAVMSTVVYGLLAWLVLRRAAPRLRWIGGGIATTLICSIAFSRVALGAHWFSDVLAGLSFGVAWVALVALAYTYHCRERLHERGLALFLLGVMAVAAITHGVSAHQGDMKRYSRPTAQSVSARSKIQAVHEAHLLGINKLLRASQRRGRVDKESITTLIA
ncbi:MAG: phosphatase PAP2 family protein, partial [Halothiobacillaceae bacterium]